MFTAPWMMARSSSLKKLRFRKPRLTASSKILIRDQQRWDIAIGYVPDYVAEQMRSAMRSGDVVVGIVGEE